MDQLCRYASRPFAFLGRYVRLHPLSHTVILISVLGAVGCSVSTQYGVKALVDALSRGPGNGHAAVWGAFALLVSLIAADNFLWRVAGWVASDSFVRVTGDLRRDLFRHLTGHAQGYFVERLPGMLTSRITATSNAAFTIENMMAWNVLPPCAATLGAILYIATVSFAMSGLLLLLAGILVVVMFRLAARGRPLHHDFADKAAAIDGEMIDIIGNMPLVISFGGLGREHRRFESTVGRETVARTRSIRWLEKIRFLHATLTVCLTLALLVWAILLWQKGAATTGQVVLVCTLGITVLSATRDLAVALVDVTQHTARLSEAIETLLVPHALTDHPEAVPLVPTQGKVLFERVSFHYPDGKPVFDDFSLAIAPGKRTGLVGHSGGGKSTLFALLQRFYDVEAGRVLIDGQDIAKVTQGSLHAAIAMVPQDISLFHRSVMENIRYGCEGASDEEVVRAAKAARCMDFIEAMPRGLDTIVGDRGVKLSGGERQRIAIARAFLKDAPILLLDEATSALDTIAEQAIREAFSHLMEGRTVIAIAHRLSSVRNFDSIVVLEQGRVVEQGPPDQLLRRNGAYFRLVRGEMARLTQTAAE